MNIKILTLPVYRLDRELYYKQREKYVSQQMYSGAGDHVDLKQDFYAKNPDRKIWFEEYLNNKYGGCWEFNEIIGFIQLHFLGNQIRGEYF